MFDHEVEPGLNEIDFSICPKANPNCKSPTYIITLALTVDYEEQHINETLVLKQEPDTCARQKK